MMSRNTRRMVSEPTHPKQRLIGGVVLTLIILLIYSILKFLAGLSTPPEGEYRLRAEAQRMQNSSINNDIDSASTLSAEIAARLPKDFVFLDIKGNPLQEEVTTATAAPSEVEDASSLYVSEGNGEQQWFVQAASFKTEDRANALADKIKARQISDTVHVLKKGDWYVVRLPPQANRRTVEQQNRQLRNLLGTRGVVRKI